MSAAIVNAVDTVRALDRRAEPNEEVTPEQAKDPERLSRLLMRVLRDIAALMRRWSPRRIDHEDRDVDASGTTLHRFPHGFGGRVRWCVVDWEGAAAPALSKDASSDESTLVLVSYESGTVTIRIEEAG
jgi:hypothetical protein